MTKILLAGVAVLDFVFHMKEFPQLPEKYRADAAVISGGGNAANSAVAVTRLGGHSLLAARLGDDEIADLILAGLKKENIDTTLTKRFPEKRSSFSSIYIDQSGERQIMNFRDQTLPADGSWIRDGGELHDCKAVLADTRWPEGAKAAMQAAKDAGIPGIIDAEAPVAEAGGALALASYVAFSAQGATDLTGETDVENAAKRADREIPGTVIVTDGENGTVMIKDGDPIWTPAFKIKAVDTLGAGDVWHGAFALALGEGMGEVDAIRFSNAAASIKCTRTGGRDGAPTRSEVNQFLKENP